MTDRKRHEPNTASEMPTKERRKQNGGVRCEWVDKTSGAKSIRRFKSIAECALDVYFLSEHLTEPEYVAGMKFREAYLRSVFNIRPSQNFNPFTNEHGRSNNESAILHRIDSERLIKDACNALPPKQTSLVIAVCGHDEFAGTKVRVHKLKQGLSALALYWRLA